MCVVVFGPSSLLPEQQSTVLLKSLLDEVSFQGEAFRNRTGARMGRRPWWIFDGVVGGVVEGGKVGERRLGS